MVEHVDDMKNKKKNVLILTTISGGGGAERLILDQMKYHDKKRFNYTIVTLKRGNIESKMIESSKKFGFKYYSLGTFNIFKASFRLNKILRAEKINVLHINLLLPELMTPIIRLLNRDVTIVMSKHSTDPFRMNPVWSLIGHIITSPASKVICVSDSVKDVIKKWEIISDRRLIVVKNGIDISRFSKRKVNRMQIGLSNNDFVVGIVGRVEVQKAHRYFLPVIVEAKSKIPNLHLIIIGTGDQEEKLKEQAKELGISDRVHFLGFRMDIDYIYNCMDVFCLPSTYEGFGLVVVEAMASEVPLMISNIDGMKEIVRKEDGLRFEPRNIPEMTEKLIYLYKNIKTKTVQNLIRNAKKRTEDFDIKNNIKRIEEIYWNQNKKTIQ
jgi:glycosyltransferase involved in cell wall biosynthesis